MRTEGSALVAWTALVATVACPATACVATAHTARGPRSVAGAAPDPPTRYHAQPVRDAIDTGMASSLTTTRKSDIYAFIFSQKGLTAGIGPQGSKITKIDE